MTLEVERGTRFTRYVCMDASNTNSCPKAINKGICYKTEKKGNDRKLDEI